MATHSSILAWRIPMDRGAWRVRVHGVAESERVKWLSTQGGGVGWGGGGAFQVSSQVLLMLLIQGPHLEQAWLPLLLLLDTFTSVLQSTPTHKRHYFNWTQHLEEGVLFLLWISAEGAPCPQGLSQKSWEKESNHLQGGTLMSGRASGAGGNCCPKQIW